MGSESNKEQFKLRVFLKWIIKKTETIPPQIQTQSLNVVVSYSYPQSFSQKPNQD